MLRLLFLVHLPCCYCLLCDTKPSELIALIEMSDMGTVISVWGQLWDGPGFTSQPCPFPAVLTFGSLDSPFPHL